MIDGDSVSVDEILATDAVGPLVSSDALLMTRMRAALRIIWRSYLEQRSELAGAQGENLGLRVSEGFFRNRCGVLEAAAVRPLTDREKDSMQGCCPMCGLTAGAYAQEATRLLNAKLEHTQNELRELRCRMEGLEK